MLPRVGLDEVQYFKTSVEGASGKHVNSQRGLVVNTVNLTNTNYFFYFIIVNLIKKLQKNNKCNCSW